MPPRARKALLPRSDIGSSKGFRIYPLPPWPRIFPSPRRKAHDEAEVGRLSSSLDEGKALWRAPPIELRDLPFRSRKRGSLLSWLPAEGLSRSSHTETPSLGSPAHLISLSPRKQFRGRGTMPPSAVVMSFLRRRRRRRRAEGANLPSRIVAPRDWASPRSPMPVPRSSSTGPGVESR
jgi:hypothetical protein